MQENDSNLTFTMPSVNEKRINISVIGLGGAGANALDAMNVEDCKNLNLVAINTDREDLTKKCLHVNTKILIGEKLTDGMGTGGDPELGEKAVQEDATKIQDALTDCNMALITAGLGGGGTGTGGSHALASLTQKMNILTVCIVTKPFSFEGPEAKQNADAAIAKLMDVSDTVLVVSNDKLLTLFPELCVEEGYNKTNEILKQAVTGITDIITKPGRIHRDFRDVSRILAGSGRAILAIGEAEGNDRVRDAFIQAIENPLLEDTDITGAKRILINILSGKDFNMGELDVIGKMVTEKCGNDVNLRFGHVLDCNIEKKVKLTVIAAIPSAVSNNVKTPPSLISSIHGSQPTGNFVYRKGELKDTKKEGVPFAITPGWGVADEKNDFDTPTYLRKKTPTIE